MSAILVNFAVLQRRHFAGNRHDLIIIGFSPNFNATHHFLMPFFKKRVCGEENTLFGFFELGALGEDDASILRCTELNDNRVCFPASAKRPIRSMSFTSTSHPAMNCNARSTTRSQTRASSFSATPNTMTLMDRSSTYDFRSTSGDEYTTLSDLALSASCDVHTVERCSSRTPIASQKRQVVAPCRMYWTALSAGRRQLNRQVDKSSTISGLPDGGWHVRNCHFHVQQSVDDDSRI
jgi:hypothetical protein